MPPPTPVPNANTARVSTPTRLPQESSAIVAQRASLSMRTGTPQRSSHALARAPSLHGSAPLVTTSPRSASMTPGSDRATPSMSPSARRASSTPSMAARKSPEHVAGVGTSPLPSISPSVIAAYLMPCPRRRTPQASCRSPLSCVAPRRPLALRRREVELVCPS